MGKKSKLTKGGGAGGNKVSNTKLHNKQSQNPSQKNKSSGTNKKGKDAKGGSTENAGKRPLMHNKIKKKDSEKERKKQILAPLQYDDVDPDDEDFTFFQEHLRYSSFLTELTPELLSKKVKNAAMPRPEMEDEDGMDFGENIDDEDDNERDELLDSDKEEEDDEDEEMEEYEREPRRQEDWEDNDEKEKAQPRLPVRGGDGKFRIPEAPLIPAEKDEETDEDEEEAGEDDYDDEEGPAEDDDEISDIEIEGEEKPVDTTSIRYINRRKEELANAATTILHAPEENISMLRSLLRSSLLEPNITIKKLALLTLLGIFKDILPGYRIHLEKEEEEHKKLSKEVKKVKEFEKNLLNAYQNYLQLLENTLNANKKKKRKSNRNEMETDEEREEGQIAYELKCVACNCLGHLLVSKPFFNFRLNIIAALIPRLAASSSSKISDICEKHIRDLLKNDFVGDISLDVAKTVNSVIKTRNYKVSGRIVDVLSDIRVLKEAPSVIQDNEEDINAKKMKDFPKNKKKMEKHMSKKQKKLSKEEKELERELKEAEAEYSAEEKKKFQTEVLKVLFHLYFRLLKMCPSQKLLKSSLIGLEKYGHLINIDFFRDILVVLRNILKIAAPSATNTTEQPQQLVEGGIKLDLDCSLQCIATAVSLASGPGAALNLDLREFYIQFYQLLLDVQALDVAMVPTIISCLESMFLKRKQLSVDRVASFMKRLCNIAIYLPSPASVALLSIVNTIVTKYPKCTSLLDGDISGAGTFSAFFPDPDSANPFATALWELDALSRHYHPTIAKMGRLIAESNPEVLRGKPMQLFHEYNWTTTGEFNPTVQPPPSKAPPSYFPPSEFLTNLTKQIEHTQQLNFELV